jgi:predicted TIM-barrel fold metal-dependent hydrolase
MKMLVLSGLLSMGLLAGGQQQPGTAASAADSATVPAKPISGPFSGSELAQFTALNPIDTHTHVYRSDAAFHALIARLNLHILDIVVVDDQGPERMSLAAESHAVIRFVHDSNGRAAFCTSFDPYKVADPAFAAQAIRGLNRDFSHGAVAVKIWKNIGMEIKNSKGNFIQPDDPVFAPIYKDIAAHQKTMIAHVADPSSAWEPENPASPDYSYYKENPIWYMYDKPHPARREQILAARDQVLAQNGDLRMVGAHLGSMEADFNQLAEHLDRYPNFAVDLAARMPYLMLEPRDRITAFILKYQDRLIYATDNDFAPRDKLGEKLSEWELSYANDWRFLATADTLDYEGHAVQGLALPEPVLRKLYHDNAMHWFPGIVGSAH